MRHLFPSKAFVQSHPPSLKPTLCNKGVTIPSTNVIYRMTEDVSQMTESFWWCLCPVFLCLSWLLFILCPAQNPTSLLLPLLLILPFSFHIDNLPCSFPPPQVNSHIHLLCCTKINLPSSIFSSPPSFFTFSYTGAPRSHEQQLRYIQSRESVWFLPSHLCEYANWTFFKGYKMAIFFSYGYKLGKKRERESEKESQ